MKKQRILSGIQPSGKLHIGNYLGAIKQFVALQDNYEAYYCVVDEHAITVPQGPRELRQNTLAIAMAYLAAGIDTEKSVIFVQSHVPAHTELGWLLNTMTPLGELERMTQFKEKGRVADLDIFREFSESLQQAIQKIKNEKDFSTEQLSIDGSNLLLKIENRDDMRKAVMAGLLNYPTLMAADILLYHAAAVPVGEDQVQHIELTRSIARRFNNRFGDTFTIPNVLLQKTSARVMALDDPTKKMSKSAASEASYIALSDTPDQIRKKIKSAATDSEKEIRYDMAAKPGISNLLAIAAEFSSKTIKELEKEFEGTSYAVFKEAVGEYIVSGLTQFQTRYCELQKHPDDILNLLHHGDEKARAVANQTLHYVKDRMGFLA